VGRGGEVVAVAQGKRRSKRTKKQRRRAPRWLLPVVVLGVMAFLYARPIASYLETRDQLAERRAEVTSLRAERARVTARRERATSLEELARAARAIGYVRPGEHLFIVKGTAAWSRRHAAEEARAGGG
jgi:cell division protein FtsB